MVVASNPRISNVLPIQTTSVYRKPTHTYCYLDWTSNHPISAKTAVIHALFYSANNVYSTPKILAKEMDYLYRVLLKNNFPNWKIMETEKKPATPIINPDISLKVRKNIFISIPYVPGLRNLEETFVI